MGRGERGEGRGRELGSMFTWVWFFAGRYFHDFQPGHVRHQDLFGNHQPTSGMCQPSTGMCQPHRSQLEKINSFCKLWITKIIQVLHLNKWLIYDKNYTNIKSEQTANVWQQLYRYYIYKLLDLMIDCVVFAVVYSRSRRVTEQSGVGRRQRQRVSTYNYLYLSRSMNFIVCQLIIMIIRWLNVAPKSLKTQLRAASVQK